MPQEQLCKCLYGSGACVAALALRAWRKESCVGGVVILRFPLFFAVFGGPKTPRCWEAQHEKCHCDTPFCVPQMLVKTQDLRAVSPYASRQSTGKMTNRPHLPRHRRAALYIAREVLRGLLRPSGAETQKSLERVSRSFCAYSWSFLAYSCPLTQNYCLRKMILK